MNMQEHEEYTASVRGLREAGARFLNLETCSGEGGEVEIVCHFLLKDEVHTLSTCTVERKVPSLFSFFGNADFPEREAARSFGVKFLGHPNLPRSEEPR
ncbi:MAG: NADH-quinone oxidoreductase subunit C [Burkholderiales bacterium]|nr:NADH-quinone oxidoreductase subunit C [Burkholderiales bacterium]